MQHANIDNAFAAIFIDYENVYYHLIHQYADIPEINDFVVDLLMNLQRHLDTQFHVQPIISKAYADFERLKSTPQGSLYLMGVETVNVLGTDHKNAADMRLCIDAMEVMYTRPEIRSFVIFAGDRDYIPLIQHLKKLAKNVISVGFEGSFSGDLMLNVGRTNFIDAISLFTEERLSRLADAAKRYNDYAQAERERLEQRMREEEERMHEEGERQAKAAEDAAKMATPEKAILNLAADAKTDKEAEDLADTGENKSDATKAAASKPSNGSALEVNKSGRGKSDREQRASDSAGSNTFNYPISDLSENERLCLSLLIKNYGMHREIWLTPFLRKLTDALPGLAEWERKALVSDLEYKGALRTERRSGTPYDYAIAMLNYNHPVVRELF